MHTQANAIDEAKSRCDVVTADIRSYTKLKIEQVFANILVLDVGHPLLHDLVPLYHWHVFRKLFLRIHSHLLQDVCLCALLPARRSKDLELLRLMLANRVMID